MLIALVKEVLSRFVARDSPKEHVTVQPNPKEYVSVQAYLDKHGIGADAIKVSVGHLDENSDDCSLEGQESSGYYIYVQAYLENHGVVKGSISISGVE